MSVATALEAIPADAPIGGPFWTWVVPVGLFLVAFLATWALYRHFSARPGGDDGSAS
jgi:hypothetical protein